MIVSSAMRKNGIIYTGFRHNDILNYAKPFGFLRDAESGFITDKGIFVNRKEALIIAKENNQIIRRCGGDETELYSENLWIGTKEENGR